MGHAGYRRRSDTCVSVGRRGQHWEIPLRGRLQGGSVGPPWGKAGAKGEKRRQAGKYERQNLGSVGQRRGSQGLRSGPRVPHSGGRGGGEQGLQSGGKPTGVLPRSGQGFKSPQGADTPGGAELTRGDKTPGVITATEGGPREDRQGWGGEKISPTARATRAQGANGSKDGTMGGPRMAAPPCPQ